MGWEDRDYSRKPKPVTWVDAYTEVTSTDDYAVDAGQADTPAPSAAGDPGHIVTPADSARWVGQFLLRWLVHTPIGLVLMVLGRKQGRSRTTDIDHILEKLSREGMTSLTAEERQRLAAASRRMRG